MCWNSIPKPLPNMMGLKDWRPWVRLSWRWSFHNKINDLIKKRYKRELANATPQYRKREPFLEPDQPYILISNFYPSWLWGISAYCFSNIVYVVLLGWPELTDISFYTFSYIICNEGGQVYTIISTLISLTLLFLKEKSLKLRPIAFLVFTF